MHRVLVAPQSVRHDRITITDPADLHHLIRVLRVRPGEPIECFDGAGRRFAGTILRATPRLLEVSVLERGRPAPPAVRLTLVQALIRPERFEWVLQKATELGVERIVPLVTERVRIRLPADREPAKRVRWRRIMQEAAAQCGQPALPKLAAPQTLHEWLESSGAGERVLIATLEAGTVPLREALRGMSAAASAAILIGPEGDFTPEEVALARRRGAQPISLGRLTLRAETAAITAIAVMRYAAGDL
jgi:16S rRNA (uracil1498-N3)-methyltransferase